MAKHLKFEGIELNGSIEEFIAKLERKGYVVDTPIFGTGFKMAAMRGEYADYIGLCKVVVSTNSDEVVNNVMVQGEDYYSVDNVLEDFEFFREKAEEYNIDYNDEEDDYFDEDDIDSFRDGSLHKHVYYKRESDGSGIMVSVGADDENDTFHVTMMLINGANSEGTEKELEMASKELDEVKESYGKKVEQTQHKSKEKDDDSGCLLVITVVVCVIGCLPLAYFMAAMMEGDSSENFGAWFMGTYFVLLLIFIPVSYFSAKLDDKYGTYSGGGRSYRGGRGSLGGWKIKKYDPAGWRKKNGTNLFKSSGRRSKWGF